MLSLFQKIKSTGEVSYIDEVHPCGDVVRLAYHIIPCKLEDLDSATEEEYINYIKFRKLISINYARLQRGQHFLSQQEIDEFHPTVSPVGAIRLSEFRNNW